jgi:pyridoxamine 5'-phosphate oxidase
MKNLSESTLSHNAFDQFKHWFSEASVQKKILLASAFCLSTVGPKGFPQSRMLLLKGYDKNGFVFYTNLNSPKGLSLKKNARASMTFYWEQLRRQVRIVGSTSSTSDREADLYFHSRPRDSQIGAWASLQSQVLDSRKTLEDRFEFFRKKFEGRKIPRPPHWTGFRLKPVSIEFWQERPNRLHDRFLYTRKTNGWKIQRLYP